VRLGAFRYVCLMFLLSRIIFLEQIFIMKRNRLREAHDYESTITNLIEDIAMISLNNSYVNLYNLC